MAGESQRIEIPDAAQFVGMWARSKYGVTLAYDELMNADVHALRERLIGLQEKFLHGGELEKEVDRLMAAEPGKTGDPSAEVVAQRFTDRFGIKLEAADLYPEPEDERLTNLDKGKKRIAYAEKVDVPKSLREMITDRARGVLRQELSSLEQFILIQIFDDTWKNHLYAMDMLKSGIGLVGFAEKDPRVVYKKEGYRYFNEMMRGIRDKVTDLIFRVRVQGPVQARNAYRETAAVHETGGSYGVAEALAARVGGGALPETSMAEAAAQPQGEAAVKVRQIVNDVPKVGRNDPCPCGSGKKYKKCHGADAA